LTKLGRIEMRPNKRSIGLGPLTWPSSVSSHVGTGEMGELAGIFCIKVGDFRGVSMVIVIEA
jgi:hypothetical protein